MDDDAHLSPDPHQPVQLQRTKSGYQIAWATLSLSALLLIVFCLTHPIVWSVSCNAQNPLECFLPFWKDAVPVAATCLRDTPSFWLILGSFHKTLFLSGEFWRAGTAALLHANEAHLFNNLVSLLIMGHLLERDLGFWRMLALMLVAQAGTIAVSLLTPDHFSMGASGITYGLTGAFISRALLQEGLQALRGLQPWRAFFKSLQGALGYVLILTLLNWQMMDVVDVWGHLGGFVAGAALVAWWHVFEAAPHSVKPIQNPKNAD